MDFWASTYRAAETKAAAAYSPRTTVFGAGDTAVAGTNFVDPEKAIEEGYEASTWVYRCIRRKQDMIAGLRWIVRQYASDGTYEDDHEHPAAVKWNYPSERFPAYYAMHRATGFLSATGNSFFGLFGPGVELGKVFDPVRFRESPKSEIRSESSIGVKPVPDDMGWVKKYKLDPPRGAIDFWDPESILHVMLPSLSEPLLGMGEIQALARAIDSDAAGHQWNLDSFGAGGMPSWLMVDYTQTASTIEKARADLVERFRDRGRQRDPWLIPGVHGPDKSATIELHKLGADAQEIDWLEGLRFHRDEIVAGFGFHVADFSREHATRDNARTAKRQAWEQGAFPLLAAFTSWGSIKLLLPEERRAGMRLVPDLRAVRELQEDATIVAEAFDKVVGPGKLSPADGARFAGLTLDTDEHPEYEVPLRALNTRPAAAPPVEGEKSMERHIDRLAGLKNPTEAERRAALKGICDKIMAGDLSMLNLPRSPSASSC